MPINVRPEIQAIADKIIATRRDIHQHPEVGFEEKRTAALVAQRLKDLGLEVQTGVGRTGVVGRLIGAAPGPEIAFRADMDALPVQEVNDVPYKSQNDGVMHACGHDGHVAILLGLAEVLSGLQSRLAGNVRFIFQPAEEGAGGARYMIADGCLVGVDEIYGLHLWNYQPYGQVGIQSGPVLAAADQFEITIRGISGHGATPQGTVDAIVVGSQLIQNLQTIVSRNTDPLERTVVTVGKFNAGTNFNVIAGEALLTGTTRAYTETNRRMIKRRMQEIIAGTAQAFGAEIDLDYEDGYPPTVNSEAETETARKASLAIAGEAVTAPYLTMGGEDFAYYLQNIPGCFIFVGSSPDKDDPLSIPHHAPYFNIDERAMILGASIFLQICEDRLFIA